MPEKMTRSRLQLSAVRSEIKGTLDKVEAYCAANRLPAAVSNVLTVAMDELLSNIVKFAYGPSEQGVIDIELAYANGELTAIVEDRGAAFNPLQLKLPETTGDLKSRKEGGLGVLFVKNLMDSVEYERHGNSNKVTLIIKVPAA
jgi:serine/threonine-protein kinase RsbW